MVRQNLGSERCKQFSAGRSSRSTWRIDSFCSLQPPSPTPNTQPVAQAGHVPPADIEGLRADGWQSDNGKALFLSHFGPNRPNGLAAKHLCDRHVWVDTLPEDGKLTLLHFPTPYRSARSNWGIKYHPASNVKYRGHALKRFGVMILDA